MSNHIVMLLASIWLGNRLPQVGWKGSFKKVQTVLQQGLLKQ